MMSGAEIVLLNPSSGRGTGRKKRKVKSTMAKKTLKRRRTRSTPLTVRQNPISAPRRSRRRRAAGAVGGAIGSLQIPQAVIDGAKNAGGMLAASFFAKRFSAGGGLRDSWNWQNYAMAIIGGFASGLLAEMVARGSGKQFLQGSIALSMYRMISDTASSRVPFLQSNFGALNEDRSVVGTDGNRYLPGDIYPALDGSSYVLGDDGYWRSTSDDYRALEGSLQPAGPLGDVVQPAGPLGDVVQPAGPLGGSN